MTIAQQIRGEKKDFLTPEVRKVFQRYDEEKRIFHAGEGVYNGKSLQEAGEIWLERASLVLGDVQNILDTCITQENDLRIRMIYTLLRTLSLFPRKGYVDAFDGWSIGNIDMTLYQYVTSLGFQEYEPAASDGFRNVYFHDEYWLQITYCEGDITLRVSSSQEEYTVKKLKTIQWYAMNSFARAITVNIHNGNFMCGDSQVSKYTIAAIINAITGRKDE